MKDKEKDAAIAGGVVAGTGAILLAAPPPIDILGGLMVLGGALGAIFGGRENTKTNAVDLSTSVINNTMNEIDNSLNVSAIVQLLSDQKINIVQPKQLECKKIDINNTSNQKVKIVQTADSETLSTLTTILNTRVDSTINQINKEGADRIGNALQGSSKQDNSITTVNKVKNSVHNTIVNSVKTTSQVSALNQQTIDFNKTDLSKNFTCDDLKVFNYSKQDAQITQMATLILNNVLLNNVSVEAKNDITQSNLGFLSDFIDALATGISKILVMIAVVAGVGLVASIIGLIVFVSIQGNRNKKNNLSNTVKTSLNDSKISTNSAVSASSSSSLSKVG